MTLSTLKSNNSSLNPTELTHPPRPCSRCTPVRVSHETFYL